MKKLTYEFVKKQFEKEGYKLLSDKYVGCDQKLECECSNSHEYFSTYHRFMGGHRCPYCIGKVKKTIEFIRSGFKKENYKLLSAEYENNKQKLSCICAKGHKCSISWNSWQRGFRCKYCANNIKLSIEFIKSEFAKEGYILVSKKYINNRGKLRYICPYDHEGTITWDNWKSQSSRCSECARIESSKKFSGDRNPMWKGGISEFNASIRRFIRSTDWYEKIFERDDYTCRKCGKKGVILNAHHIITIKNILDCLNITTVEEAKNYFLLFDVNNGITLCENCHNWVHSNKNDNKMFIEEVV